MTEQKPLLCCSAPFYGVARCDCHSAREGELWCNKHDLLLVFDDRGPWWRAIRGNRAGFVSPYFVEALDRRETKEAPFLALATGSFAAQCSEHHNLRSEDLVLVVDARSDGWWAVVKDNRCGFVPSSLVRRCEPNYDRRVVPARALVDYQSTDDPAFSFNRYDRLLVIERSVHGWTRVINGSRWDWVGSASVEVFTDPTQPQQQQQQQDEQCAQHTKEVRATRDCPSQRPDQLGIRKDQRLTVVEQDTSGWWVACDHLGGVGCVPSSAVEDIETSTRYTASFVVATAEFQDPDTGALVHCYEALLAVHQSTTAVQVVTRDGRVAFMPSNAVAPLHHFGPRSRARVVEACRPDSQAAAPPPFRFDKGDLMTAVYCPPHEDTWLVVLGSSAGYVSRSDVRVVVVPDKDSSSSSTTAKAECHQPRPTRPPPRMLPPFDEPLEPCYKVTNKPCGNPSELRVGKNQLVAVYPALASGDDVFALQGDRGGALPAECLEPVERRHTVQPPFLAYTREVFSFNMSVLERGDTLLVIDIQADGRWRFICDFQVSHTQARYLAPCAVTPPPYRVRATKKHQAAAKGELSFAKGDVLLALERNRGTRTGLAVKGRKLGLVPWNCVEPLNGADQAPSFQAYKARALGSRTPVRSVALAYEARDVLVVVDEVSPGVLLACDEGLTRIGTVRKTDTRRLIDPRVVYCAEYAVARADRPPPMPYWLDVKRGDVLFVVKKHNRSWLAANLTTNEAGYVDPANMEPLDPHARPPRAYHVRAVRDHPARQSPDEVTYWAGDVMMALGEAEDREHLLAFVGGRFAKVPKRDVVALDSQDDDAAARGAAATRSSAAQPLGEAEVEVGAGADSDDDDDDQDDELRRESEAAWHRPRLMEALYPHTKVERGELSVAKGDLLLVYEETGEWWRASCGRDVGFIPQHHAVPVDRRITKLRPYPAFVTADVNPEPEEGLPPIKEGSFVVVIDNNQNGWLRAVCGSAVRSLPVQCVKICPPRPCTGAKEAYEATFVVTKTAHTAQDSQWLSYEANQVLFVFKREGPEQWVAANCDQKAGYVSPDDVDAIDFSVEQQDVVRMRAVHSVWNRQDSSLLSFNKGSVVRVFREREDGPLLGIIGCRLGQVDENDFVPADTGDSGDGDDDDIVVDDEEEEEE